MKYIWNPSLDDVLEAQELAKEHGKKAGDNYEEEFLEVMKKKNKKPSCATELNPDELVKEYLSHDKKVLSISHDSEGNENINLIKNEEQEDD